MSRRGVAGHGRERARARSRRRPPRSTRRGCPGHGRARRRGRPGRSPRWFGRPARTTSRSLISICIRLAPSTMNADVLPGLVVELVGVLPLEQLAEVGDLAQRLGEVVRGDVGELLEVGVGAGQLGARAAGAGAGRARSARSGRPAGPRITSTSRAEVQISAGPLWTICAVERRRRRPDGSGRRGPSIGVSTAAAQPAREQEAGGDSRTAGADADRDPHVGERRSRASVLSHALLVDARR